jgi:mRNA interferase HigB
VARRNSRWGRGTSLGEARSFVEPPDAALVAVLIPTWEHATLQEKDMRILSRSTLWEFWKKHADAEGPLKAWFAEVEKAEWKTMMDIKRKYAAANIVDDERVVFNVGGNKYRLVVKLWLPGQIVWTKFIGTHQRYDQIDVTKL